MLDNVVRMDLTDAEAFRRDHVSSGRPVIITGLYEGTRTAELADESVLRAAAGHVRIDVRPAGIEPLLVGIDNAPPRGTTLGGFLDELFAGGPNGECCAELDCPDELRALVPPPAIATALGGTDVVSHLFVAGTGGTAHLHYDGDLRDVLMVQVMGRKRYVIIDPAQSRKLRPESRPGLSRTSGLFLQHLTETELDGFLRWVGAWDCVLHPAEVLLIPAASWHWVRYLEPAVSVNFRFAWNPRFRFLAEELADRSVEWLCLASHLRDDHGLTEDDRNALDELMACVRDLEGGPGEVAGRAASIIVELCSRLGLDVAAPPLDTGDWDRRRRRQKPIDTVAQSVWEARTRVALADGCRLVIPVRGGPLVLVQHGRLVAELPQDPGHPWTWPVLAHVDRTPGVTVDALAEATMVDPMLVAAFLAEMEAARWVRAMA